MALYRVVHPVVPVGRTLRVAAGRTFACRTDFVSAVVWLAEEAVQIRAGRARFALRFAEQVGKAQRDHNPKRAADSDNFVQRV
jgi:hypothetical protein